MVGLWERPVGRQGLTRKAGFSAGQQHDSRVVIEWGHFALKGDGAGDCAALAGRGEAGQFWEVPGSCATRVWQPESPAVPQGEPAIPETIVV